MAQKPDSSSHRPVKLSEGATKNNSKPVSVGPKTTAPPPKPPSSKK